MLIGWIANVLTLAFGLALFSRKPYRELRLVQLYAFGTLAVSLLYKSLFYNWEFYLVSVILQSCLFATAYWEVCHKMEDRTHHWIWPVLIIVASVYFWPIPIVARVIIPFYVVDTFVAFGLFFALRRKNPFLVIWALLSAYSLLVALLKTFVPQAEFLIIASFFGVWISILGKIALLSVVLWKPAARWLYGVLKRVPIVVEAGLNGASPKQQEEIRSGHSRDRRYWRVVSEMMSRDSALMRDLSRKEYLTPEELKFYLGMEWNEVEEFIQKHSIKKIYISEYPSTWFVRRKDAENIGL